MIVEKLALHGGERAKSKPFPEWPTHDEREIAAVTNVIQSGQWWRVAGSQVSAFEQEFARYHEAEHAVAVTSGSHAIELALTALNIGRNDEVIVPAYTFIATATAVLNVNAVPILVDVHPDTYCIDPEAVEAAITPRTKAIIPVHMAGHIVDMDTLITVAQRHNVHIIEDAAHAHGAEWKGQRVGALHSAGIFSFQAGKLMTAGEGGLILSHDAEFIERCFLFGSGGRPKTDRTYQHILLGSTCRMSELQAAVLRVQLTRLDEQIARREINAPLLDHRLAEIAGVAPQKHDPRVTRHPHYMYIFCYDPAAFGGLSREQFVDALIAEGVPAFVGFPAIHRTPVFKQRAFEPRWRAEDEQLPDYSLVSCPISERLGNQTVWLHHRVLLGDEEDIVELAEAILKIQRYSQK
jgi:3-amino-5-hydroxybenzoate synthase